MKESTAKKVKKLIDKVAKGSSIVANLEKINKLIDKETVEDDIDAMANDMAVRTFEVENIDEVAENFGISEEDAERVWDHVVNKSR